MASRSARDEPLQLLHPGMPKAASTWLQNVWFASHPELAILGPEDAEQDLARRFVVAVERLVQGSDLAPSPGTDLAELVVERAARAPTARVVGLSHESLVGAWPAPRNSGFLARRLGELFPGAAVLLVVREQRAALASSWREFVRMGGTLSFERFVLDPAVGGDPVGHPMSTAVLGNVTYAPIVQAYRAAFGPDRVLVLPMERLQRDPAAFVGGICRFLGVEPHDPPPQQANVQLSGPALAVLRLCNYLFHTRRHVRYGPKPIAHLLQTFSAEPPVARGNPHYRRALISDYAQRWLAKKVMPRLDRLGLRWFARRGDPFAKLPAPVREHLTAKFQADNHALREFVDWEPGEFGYLVASDDA